MLGKAFIWIICWICSENVQREISFIHCVVKTLALAVGSVNKETGYRKQQVHCVMALVTEITVNMQGINHHVNEFT